MEEKKGGRKEGGRDEGERGRKERKEYVCSSCSVFVIRSTRLLARWACFHLVTFFPHYIFALFNFEILQVVNFQSPFLIDKGDCFVTIK